MKAVTNKGRVIDFEKLIEKQGSTIAVSGNGARLNARGDVLGRGATVKKSAQQVQQDYHKNVAQAVVDYRSIKSIDSEVMSLDQAVAAMTPEQKAKVTKKRSTSQSDE